MNARIRVVAAVMITAACWQPLRAAELVKVVNADGRESQLLQKLITVRDITPIYTEPTDKAKVKRVGPFNIFFQIKTDSGKLQENGFYRITTSTENKDNPADCFWVKPEDVQVWASRFAIKPRQIDQKTTFTVDLAAGGTAQYTPEKIPSDATAYSFVLNGSQDDGDTFDVAFCVARVEDDGTASSLNQLGEMSLEICFVLENGSYLSTDYKNNGRIFKSYIDDLGDSWTKEIDRLSKTAKVPVKMSLLVYTDTHPNIKTRVPTVVVDMTDDLSQWLQGIKSLQVDNDSGDIPNDGYSGVYSAVTGVSWGSNSAKHIVVLGNSPFNPYGRNGGNKSDLPGKPNILDWAFDRSDPYGFWNTEWDTMFGINSSGKTEQQILATAYQEGGNLGNELRRNKYLHMVHVGVTAEQKFGQELINTAKDLNSKLYDVVKDMSDREIFDRVNRFLDDNPQYIKPLFASWAIESLDAYDAKAQETMKRLAQSGYFDGYYTHMNPDGAEVDRVTKELGGKINDAISVIADISQGKEKEVLGDTSSRANELTRPIFTIVGSALSQSELIKNPVQLGTAKLQDEATGRSVGEQVVMVSEDELRRLAGTLNSLYESFERKRRAADRQDVNDVLADLQASLAQAASGQEITADTQLDSLITDLPLRTEALRLSAGDIAVMSTDAFDSWLESVSDAEKSIESLLTGDPTRWITINAAALSRAGTPSAQYAFLRLSELP